ncbi:MAG: LysM peptidoglycan-binding domain-containing protein, partial [Proteobacteria bacterium]|nr:LysM peptidoglycan-binding domain-containing protein [Pseudomonadota bacterium]
MIVIRAMIILAVLVSGQSFAASSAKPKQTNDFAGAPPVPGTRRVLAAGEAPEDYTVQRGDTLFDICEQLLGEARYWPKLWALNPEIKNPHFVFPGMKIRFYPGDPEVPPYLLVSTEDEALPVDQGPVAPEDLVIQSPAEKQVSEEPPFDLVDAKDIPVPDDIAREIL